MKKKLSAIVLLYLLLCAAACIFAGEAEMKHKDKEASGTIRRTPLARLYGLDRLYFQHIGWSAGALNAPAVVTSFLPELLRIGDVNRETGDAKGVPEGVDVRDFLLPAESQGRKLWIRQIIYADHPRVAKLWWALYDSGERSDVWYFIPDPSQTESKVLSNYEIVDTSTDGERSVALRIQGTMIRPQGAWWVVGKVFTFSTSNVGLTFSHVCNAFGFFQGYDKSNARSAIDISTERELKVRFEERIFTGVPKSVLKECKFQGPQTDENWSFSWQGLERAALCVTGKPGAKTRFRAFNEPSFIERAGRILEK